MVEDIKELQDSLLILIKEFDVICRTNNIKYTLAGGSLLGAVRHKGFIPWDDDFDVALDYPNFLKLKEVLKTLNHPWITADLPDYTNESFYREFIKIYDSRTTFVESDYRVRGIFLDIFPIIPISNNHKLGVWKFRYMKTLSLSIFYYNDKSFNTGTYRKVIYWFLNNIIGTKHLRKYIEKKRLKLSKKNLKFWSDPDGTSKGVIPREIFTGEYKDYEFENLKLMGLSQSDKYLTYVFGDYMKLPKNTERAPKHVIYYSTTKSYMDYNKEHNNER